MLEIILIVLSVIVTSLYFVGKTMKARRESYRDGFAQAIEYTNEIHRAIFEDGDE